MTCGDTTSSTTRLPIWDPSLPLETARTWLRVHRAADLDDLVQFHGDPVTSRFIPWPVRDREETEKALSVKLRQDRAAAAGECLVLAVELKTEHTVVGETLLIREDDSGVNAELGYVIARSYEGRGLATEAAGAMIHLARDLRVRRLFGVVDPRNGGSTRVLEKLGFSSDGPFRRPGAEPGSAPLVRWVMEL